MPVSLEHRRRMLRHRERREREQASEGRASPSRLLTRLRTRLRKVETRRLAKRPARSTKNGCRSVRIKGANKRCGD